jgi:hypothetical protein
MAKSLAGRLRPICSLSEPAVKHTGTIGFADTVVKGGSTAFEPAGKLVVLMAVEKSCVPTAPALSDHNVSIPLAGLAAW